jgi:hypothetical protein
MHLNLAYHLGCENFITFDQDFVRIKNQVKEQLNINVISDIKEIEKKI